MWLLKRAWWRGQRNCVSISPYELQIARNWKIMLMYFTICSRQWCNLPNWWKIDDDHITHLMCLGRATLKRRSSEIPTSGLSVGVITGAYHGTLYKFQVIFFRFLWKENIFFQIGSSQISVWFGILYSHQKMLITIKTLNSLCCTCCLVVLLVLLYLY